jgi:hypothetical protein
VQRDKASFQAVGSDGRKYTITIHADAPTAENPNAEEDGTISLRTSDGHRVRRMSQGKYQITNTGVDLTSDDPEAP